MQNIDLNICLSYFANASEYDIIGAISALIKNEWVKPFPFNNKKQITIKYDSAIQTLKICNKSWTIKASDFMQTTFIKPNSLVLLNGIIRLMKNNYQLEFRSKFGKFTPFIAQKQGVENAVPTLHINVEEPSTFPSNWTELKNDFNENETTNNDDGTIITICPVNEETIAFLKYHFSFTQDWDEVLDANGDYLLIDKSDKPNKIFVDGIAKEYTLDANPPLLYSYDLRSSFLYKVNGNHDREWYTQRAICIVLYNLSDEDKKQIYPIILNNENCYEWTLPEVQRIVVEFLSKQEPDKYAICEEDHDPAIDVIELVRETGKTIVPVADDIYKELSDHVKSVYAVMQEELVSKYSKPGLTNEDLSPSEQKNLQLLKEFLIYFANHFDQLRKWLSHYELDQIPLEIVDDLPEHWGTYSIELRKLIIDRSVLSDTGKTFNCASLAVRRGFSFGLDDYDFTNLWQDTTINFFATLKYNKCNCQAGNECQTKDNE